MCFRPMSSTGAKALFSHFNAPFQTAYRGLAQRFVDDIKDAQMDPGADPRAFDTAILRSLSHTARFSPDPSSQNAAMLLVGPSEWSPMTVAVNNFPTGVLPKPERWERPGKYERVVHAETGAIVAAARRGINTSYSTLYACWAACGPCAAQIIEAGITRVVTLESSKPELGGGNLNDKWNDTIRIAVEMFTEAGVEVDYIPHPVTEEGFTLRRNGQPFWP